MENAKGQSDTLYDGPRQKAEEFELYWVRFDFLRFECVNDPHGDVAYEQKGDHLSAWLGAVVFR